LTGLAQLLFKRIAVTDVAILCATIPPMTATTSTATACLLRGRSWHGMPKTLNGFEECPVDPGIVEHQIKTTRTLINERKQFMADRIRNGHRVTYLAHAKNYVMVRHPGCIPFCVSEREWRDLPLRSI
jgi:hypothetical protein